MQIFLVAVLLAVLVLLIVAVMLMVRMQRAAPDGADHLGQLDRIERQIRQEVQQSAQAARQEGSVLSGQLQQVLVAQLAATSQLQSEQLDRFAQQLAQLSGNLTRQSEQQQQTTAALAHQSRDEQAVALGRFGEGLHQTVTALTESNAQRMAEIRQTLESRLRDMQADNGVKLEEMRRTVDEKLHATLEKRLGESFQIVSDRLEKVHQGLGEMQQLATGVGDLKRVLTNVKSRGTWGEVQLQMILEQMLTLDQYAANVETVPASGQRVEFAIRLPGQGKGEPPVWLPVDAKFPKEQYERLMLAAEQADAEGVSIASKELDRAVRNEARTIAEKYVSPPHTTDFAILFLPTEGLYAEVMRRPGLADDLQRQYRVTIAGPSTLSALLNSLQMGFRTLALQQRSSEVWQVLGAVKTEFDKFGAVLSATRTALEKAAKNIENAEVRSRQMVRKLKGVEAMTTEQAAGLLELGAVEDESAL